MYIDNPLPNITHKRTLMYILGINFVIIKNMVHVNVVHVIVEFKWNVSPKKERVKKNLEREQASKEWEKRPHIIYTPIIFCIILFYRRINDSL